MLVVDTIGLNDKTFFDNYHTPHTDKLHVTERWQLIEDGKKLEILMTIDDSDTFNQPWQAPRQYDRVNRKVLLLMYRLIAATSSRRKPAVRRRLIGSPYALGSSLAQRSLR